MFHIDWIGHWWLFLIHVHIYYCWILVSNYFSFFVDHCHAFVFEESVNVLFVTKIFCEAFIILNFLIFFLSILKHLVIFNFSLFFFGNFSHGSRNQRKFLIILIILWWKKLLCFLNKFHRRNLFICMSHWSHNGNHIFEFLLSREETS